MQLQQTQRHNVKLRIGISGTSGFGKTYSALQLAYGMTNDWSKIAVIDSENSASLYSDFGNYNIVNLTSPYTPERYIEAIKLCEKNSIEVIIIDSITHEWQGKGGCLQIHEQLGGRFQDWSKITPRHQSFIDAILSSSSHVITTVRRKTDYSLDVNSNGRTKVTKHGTKELTREGFEYELTVNFEIVNDKHLSKVSKDRTRLFKGKPEFLITKGTGKMLMEWCNQGDSLKEKAKKEIVECTTVEGLRHLYKKYLHLKEELNDTILSRKREIESLNTVVSPKEIVNPIKPNQTWN